jgi:hypothetical protein
LAQLPILTGELRSIRVIVRFCLRMLILVVFAAFGGIGFDRSLTALLWMSAILSSVLAALEHEAPLDTVLNHWDEALAYAALCCLFSGFSPALPV